MMRLVAFMVGLLLIASQATASAAFVNRSAPSGATTASVSTLTTTATSQTTGNLVVCGVNRQTGSNVSTVTDTAGNSYGRIVNAFTIGTALIDVWYAFNITGHASNVTTVALSSGSIYASVTCSQFSGLGTSASFGANSNATGTGTAISSGSVTTTGSDSVIYAYAMNGNGANWTAGTGYALTFYAVAGDATNYYADEYHIVSASEAATAVLDASNTWGIVAVSFNVATAGSGAPAQGLLGVGK